MKKQLLASIITMGFVLSPVYVLAAENYKIETPAVYNNQPQTQYPLPVKNYQEQGYNYENNQLQGNVTMVPANTVFTATTTSPLNSEVLRSGDGVTMYLSSDFYYGNKLIAPAGSRLNGMVLSSKKGGAASRSGRIEIKFTTLITPYGQTIPISAKVQTDDGTGILKAGTAKDAAKEYAKDVGIGAAAGAVLGTALGALSSGSVGKGAIYGTALGGGMGMLQTVMDKGGNVDIPQGAQLNIILDQPITFSSYTPY